MIFDPKKIAASGRGDLGKIRTGTHAGPDDYRPSPASSLADDLTARLDVRRRRWLLIDAVYIGAALVLLAAAVVLFFFLSR
jgi:hypothetical protein